MIRSWNLYQLYFLVSGHQLKQKKYKSPRVFSQSVIINSGRNYSVIFVTRGPGGDDSQWPGDDQRHDDDDQGYFLHSPGLGHGHSLRMMELS